MICDRTRGNTCDGSVTSSLVLRVRINGDWFHLELFSVTFLQFCSMRLETINGLDTVSCSVQHRFRHVPPSLSSINYYLFTVEISWINQLLTPFVIYWGGGGGCWRDSTSLPLKCENSIGKINLNDLFIYS